MTETTQAIWAVSDGRAGLANQVLGLAEAVARLSPRPIEIKTVERRTLYNMFGARGAKGVLRGAGEALSSPWPRLLIGCGRASISLSIAVKRASEGATFTVQTQDPRTAAGNFDLVVPPMHDNLTGENVFPIVGSPNRLTPEQLKDAAQKFAARYATLPRPRVAALIGGDAKRLKLNDRAMRTIIGAFQKLEAEGAGLMITTSRRTGEENTEKLRTALAGKRADIWDGTGENPYLGMLALADYILVTEDSVNMATDAAATGKPVFTLKLSGHNPKYTHFHEELQKRGIEREFGGTLENFAYAPLNETERAAREICRRAKLPLLSSRQA